MKNPPSLAKDGSGTTEELTFESGKSTTSTMDVSNIYMHQRGSQVESTGAVVGKHGVGMLEKCDRNNSRVDPEVWDTICPHHRSKAIGHAGINECADPQECTNIGDKDILALVRYEDDR